RGQPKFLRVIRPAMGNVVLATTINLKRAVGKHGAFVFDGRSLVAAIQLDLIRAGEIMQSLPVRRQRGRKRIKGDVFAAIRPERLAGDFGEHLKTVHEFHHAAGLETLTRIVVARATVLVPAETATWKLTVKTHHGEIILLGRGEEFRVARLLIINA